MPRALPLPRTLGALVGLLVPVLLASGCSTDDGAPGSAAAAAPSSVPSAPATATRYVALGDSFTAAPLVPTTDVASGCFRSTGNYPTIVARRLGADLDDRSCGGADVANLTTSQFPGVEPQFAALTRDTDVVTLGIGGNENNVFARLTKVCPSLRDQDPDGSPCTAYMTRGGRDVLRGAIVRSRPKVLEAVREIQRRAPRAKVLLVGYPQIVNPENACARLPLAPGDYDYAARVNQELSITLAEVARRTGTTYVDVWTASQGHDICSDKPWVNGAVADERRAAAYHPFAAEQAAVADLVLRALGR